ncbi:MAG: EF-P lysine aminoacylase GenX [Kangiellaceae bacterium]|nr:EF-P lysine aminoacylase GenX [Kangiellaceae bacterium]
MSAKVNNLKNKLIKRSGFINRTRQFFEQRTVLEVDTSLLRECSVTDPYMSAFKVSNTLGKHCGFLQTSPEYAMKKLICAGSGDIFQLSKMFRADECGPMHAAEFTMLEWYRVGFELDQLIDEVCEYIQQMLGSRECQKLSYREAFITHLDIDPYSISKAQLAAEATQILGELPEDLLFDNYLTLLFSEKVETQFKPQLITVINEFPASQASLAKTKLSNGIQIAERFEVYCEGMELANGFDELTDAKVQLLRFEQDNQLRKQFGHELIDIDDGFIESLILGLPQCSGVALGIDRLMMIEQSAQHINDVLLS